MIDWLATFRDWSFAMNTHEDITLVKHKSSEFSSIPIQNIPRNTADLIRSWTWSTRETRNNRHLPDTMLIPSWSVRNCTRQSMYRTRSLFYRTLLLSPVLSYSIPNLPYPTLHPTVPGCMPGWGWPCCCCCCIAPGCICCACCKWFDFDYDLLKPTVNVLALHRIAAERKHTVKR